eukprot:Phypoly_transcript_05592.p2 GENE.Phypoly_transcript_05592~~Phypoly_transcript_05592.p2  ORF type:complete len:132 (+),score=20.46 Phypoly_transcript_05592:27-422(+)
MARASIQLPNTGEGSEANLVQPSNGVLYHSASYETTPLLSYTGSHELPPQALHSSGRNYNNTSNRVYNNTSNRVYDSSGKYTSVPKYPSNKGYQPVGPIIPGLNAVLLTVVLQSIGFTLVLPSMWGYLQLV